MFSKMEWGVREAFIGFNFSFVDGPHRPNCKKYLKLLHAKLMSYAQTTCEKLFEITKALNETLVKVVMVIVSGKDTR